MAQECQASEIARECSDSGPSTIGISRRQSIRCLLTAIAGHQLTGCSRNQTFETISLPGKHSILLEHLHILSEFKIPRYHPLIEDLKQTRSTVLTQLELPSERDDVVIYLFQGQEEYRSYLETTFPSLPARRAYFVGTPRELAVYTYWGDRIQEDLRHEYTHGILHSTLGKVPLWLDEGLAEYFEVGGPRPGAINLNHASKLIAALQHGWRPDIDRLESLHNFEQMQKIDYQEAWVWVHYLMHNSLDSRQILVQYLSDIRDSTETPSLAARVRSANPDLERRFIAYLTNLQTAHFLAQSRGESGT